MNMPTAQKFITYNNNNDDDDDDDDDNNDNDNNEGIGKKKMRKITFSR